MSQEDQDQQDGGGVPEWVVTFGDMMSLLLTFFIMLVSLSEIKKDEQYRAVVDSLRRQFGYDATLMVPMPGQSKPRNAAVAKLATMGRARRYNIFRGGEKPKAPIGDNHRVRIVRPGTRTAVGTAITFAEGSAELTEEHKQDLLLQAGEFGGKPQKVEVRGHSSLREMAIEPAAGLSLSYQRALRVKEFLVAVGIDERRILTVDAGPHEPVYSGPDRTQLKANPRVEVFLLDLTVDDAAARAGSADTPVPLNEGEEP